MVALASLPGAVFFAPMRRTEAWWLAVALVLGGVGSATAALTTLSLADGLVPDDLGNAILGSGVTISNVSVAGCASGLGTFAGGEGIVGLESGVLMSSGSIAFAGGPNQSPSSSTLCEAPGDPALDALVPGSQTTDAAVLEFDVVPAGDTLVFQYVFASEEYNEFVGTLFNDVIGFFVNGVNLALLPGTQVPVAVNTVNASSNAVLFIDNDFATPANHLDIEADGLTQVMSFAAPVVPGQANHVKLAIADVSDARLDSWIFIGAGSLSSTTADVALSVRGRIPVVDVDVGATGRGLGTAEAAGFALGGGVAAPAAAAITAPSGLTAATRNVRRSVNRRGRARLRLRLTRAGRRLLRETGSLQLLVVIRVTGQDGSPVDFQHLVQLP